MLTAAARSETNVAAMVLWLLFVAALLVIVIGVPTMIVLMVRKQKVSGSGSKG